jgi:imidazolonepropionase-like amidohydrolase
VWLTNCTVIDIEDPERSVEGGVRVEDGTIVEIAEGAPPPESHSMDLRGRYLLPGLISCHTHLTEVYPFSAADGESSAESSLRALAGATQALQAGVTTIRCVHEQNRADLLLRSADAKGWVRTPRILAGGRAITTTGGHGDGGGGCVRADGPEEFLKAARTELAAGADHIKIFISGGIGDASENITTVQMTLDEMRATVTAADVHGAYVVAHSGNSASIKLALEAGVRSFEHGYELDDEAAAAMVERRAFLTPTINCTHVRSWMLPRGFDESQVRRAAEVEPIHARSLETAIRHGVKIVNGTDGQPAEPVDGTSMTVIEAELLSRAGLGPRGALLASTANAAELLGLESRVGTVAVGFDADLIAVKGDPLEDISALRSIDWVMSKGEVLRDDRDEG